MAELKLGKLPARAPIKLTITLLPDFHRQLQEYADLYAQSYGEEEPVTNLIPGMLQIFLDGDRAFAKAQAAKSKSAAANARP